MEHAAAGYVIVDVSGTFSQLRRSARRPDTMARNFRPYVIKQGEHLAKLAFLHGFDAEEVWNHPKNAALTQRRDPEILYPGEIIHLPTGPRRAMAIRKGGENRYQATVPTIALPLRFTNDAGPLVKEPCEVTGCIGAPLSTSLNEHGTITLQVSVLCRSVEVYFPGANVRHVVQVGTMDPADTPSGEEKRLQNLGYLDDELTENYPRDFLLALARKQFEQVHGAANTYADNLIEMAGA